MSDIEIDDMIDCKLKNNNNEKYYNRYLKKNNRKYQKTSETSENDRE